MKYLEEPKTYDEHIKLMETKGIRFKDKFKSTKFLENINYYKINKYLKSFTSKAENNKPVYFEDVIENYYFDRELRNTLLGLIEIIETSIKSKITYTLVHSTKDPFAHTKEENFQNKKLHKLFLDILNKEEKRSKEPFIKEYRKKYKLEKELPLWISIEVLSLGTISKLYTNLNNKEKKKIAKSYGLSFKILESWLRNLTLIRNFSAHNSKIIDREYNALVHAKEINNMNAKKLSGQTLMIKYLIKQIEGDYDFLRIDNLMEELNQKNSNRCSRANGK